MVGLQENLYIQVAIGNCDLGSMGWGSAPKYLCTWLHCWGMDRTCRGYVTPIFNFKAVSSCILTAGCYAKPDVNKMQQTRVYEDSFGLLGEKAKNLRKRIQALKISPIRQEMGCCVTI